jgi:beta-N-acetylhexosaminidase
VGKHFPGHGYVMQDSHVEFPVDPRPLEQIEEQDLIPYQKLIPEGLQGVMPAHVVYPGVDAAPAGFSRRWLHDVLRGRLGFHGTLFSDDLSMEAATVAGGIVKRAGAALQAGCDMVLVCNRPHSAEELLSGLSWSEPLDWKVRVGALYGGTPARGMESLAGDAAWQQARAHIEVA